MSRTGAMERAGRYFDEGDFFAELARRVAFQTESQEPAQQPELYRYLEQELRPSLEGVGFSCRIFDNPVSYGGPLLVAERREGDGLPTIMSYGHGDVVLGYAEQWASGLDPWLLSKRGERWYGRGTADNKGQHTINLAAMKAVLEERGALGFNVVILIETGEENGSPGLREFCESHRELFKADVFIASDGPRLAPDRPTIFMGSRGVVDFALSVDLREGGHHSGNWGGLLANPGVILAHAIASLTSARGEIRVPDWRPESVPESVKAALAELVIDGGEAAPEIDPDWGEPGLSAAEKVFAWNTFEVLAFTTGNPDKPVNAIPPRAKAHCHIRYVVPCEVSEFVPALRRHLDDRGFDRVEIIPAPDGMAATRLDPSHPWVKWAVASIDASSGRATAVLPNLGGSLPNDVFSELLGLPTIWVPHSYASCSQHAPNEHVLEPVCREALQIMAGLFWDLGAGGTPAHGGTGDR